MKVSICNKQFGKLNARLLQIATFYISLGLLFIFADDGEDDDEDNTDGDCHKEHEKSRHEG